MSRFVSLGPWLARHQRGLLLGLGGACLALTLYWASRSRLDVPPVAEVLRAELELREGRLYRRGEAAPFTGVMIERYPEGALLSRSSVVAGRLHGLSEGWYPDGQLQVRETFVHGVSHGLRTKWHPNGATQTVATIVEGQLHGRFLRWHENGLLAEDLHLNRGTPDGWSQAFHPDGRLKARVRLEHGRVVEQQFWPEGAEGNKPPALSAAGAEAARPGR